MPQHYVATTSSAAPTAIQMPTAARSKERPLSRQSLVDLNRMSDHKDAAVRDCSLNADFQDTRDRFGGRRLTRSSGYIARRDGTDESPENSRCQFPYLESGRQWRGREHCCGDMFQALFFPIMSCLNMPQNAGSSRDSKDQIP